MSKRTKLYVRVGMTLSKIENFPSIFAAMPNGKDITEHLEACKSIGEFRPIEIEVKEDEFTLMLKDIRKRLGVDVKGLNIPIVLSSNTQPIIRITKNKQNDGQGRGIK